MRIDSVAYAAGAAPSGPSPADADDEESSDLEIDEVEIDEANLPLLDMQDPETLALEQSYDDLLDRRWLERGVDEDEDEERSALDDLGVTIELNAAGAEDDAEEVDLDVGELLEALPSESSDADLPLGQERGEGSLGLAALHGMLLPEDEEEHDDAVVGDDERFPVFDDGGPAWRPAQGDEEGPEGEPS